MQRVARRRRRVQSGGAHNAVSHFTPDSALNAGRLSACKHAVNSIWAPHEIEGEIAESERAALEEFQLTSCVE